MAGNWHFPEGQKNKFDDEDGLFRRSTLITAGGLISMLTLNPIIGSIIFGTGIGQLAHWAYKDSNFITHLSRGAYVGLSLIIGLMLIDFVFDENTSYILDIPKINDTDEAFVSVFLGGIALGLLPAVLNKKN